MTGSPTIDAQRAFDQAARARRRAALTGAVRRRSPSSGRLDVYDAHSSCRAHIGLGRGVREIPLDAIAGTTEPARASLFDGSFRPARAARCRWERVWLAEQRGMALPPIVVVPVGERYAIRDGHHRVSVARARGAVTIDAVVEGV